MTALSSRWRSTALMGSSLLASALNLYALVLLPTLIGPVQLDDFVRDNYVGGLYLFGIASSIAPFGVYLFSGGHAEALRKYLVASGLAALLGIGGCLWVTDTFNSLLCLGSAICMHTAGFFLASMIRDERLMTAASLKLLQPAFFAALLTLERFYWLPVRPWAHWYALSCGLGLLGFAMMCKWPALKQHLAQPGTIDSSWRGVLSRMAMSVSIPLFFQIELIVIDTISQVQVGAYAIVQKLYSSVSTSMFGSLSVLLAMRRLRMRQGASHATSQGMGVELSLAVLCALVVGCIGLGLHRISPKSELPASTILIAMAVASTFSVASFLNLRVIATKPMRGVSLTVLTVAGYCAVVAASRPQHIDHFLGLSGAVFLTIATFSYWLLNGKTKPS